MSLIVSIIDGLKKDPLTLLGGANEGHIEGFIDDLVNGIAGGVRDFTGGELLVTENSPAAMTVLVANGVAYVPQTTYDADVVTKTKFWRVVVKDEAALTIGANSSGSTRIDLICIKVDKTISPNIYANNVATLEVVAGTPGAGVPATPSNHYKLAEITVTNGETAINTADITDRRVQIQLRSAVTESYYGHDVGGDDTYAVTIEGISSYAQILGKSINILADTANTDAATLNVNGLGAKTIKKAHDQDLATGDIEAGQVITVVYDGTVFQMQSQTAATAVGGSGIPINGWNVSAEAGVYVSVTSFKIVGLDRTAIFRKGTRIRYKQGGAYEYGVVISSAFATDTTITLLTNTDYAIANATITDLEYSHIVEPEGYPDYFNVAAPTFTVSKFDNGAGGQPTVTENKIAIVGKTAFTRLRATGTMASTINNVDFANPYPAPQNQTDRTNMGIGYFQTAADTNFLAVSVKIGTSWFILMEATIADNTVIPTFTVALTFEI